MPGVSAKVISIRHLRLGRRLGLAFIASALVFACLPASALADGGSSISGSFVSAQGNPVPNVYVNLVGAVSSDGYNSPSTRTDENGSFVFTSVPDGTFGISFYSDGACGGNSATYYATPSGISVQATDARPITVEGSDVGGVTVVCPLTYAISGTVVGPSGKPLSSISIQAAGTDDYGWTDSLADGSFSITGLTPGDYMLSVQDESGAFQGGLVGPSGVVQTASQATTFTIASSDIAGVRITGLTKALSISGHVKDANGNPLAGLSVTFGQNGISFGYQNVTTAADGSFAIPGGTSDQVGYLVVSDPNGAYATGIWSRVGLTADPSKANEISLGAGSVKNLNIVAKLGQSISGTVLAADGTPLQAMYISAILLANGAAVEQLTGIDGASVGPDGTFSLTDLPPATFVLQVGLANGGSGYYSSTGLVADESAATPVDVSTASVAGLTIQVPPDAFFNFSGNLVGSDGSPIANAGLYLQSTAAPAFAEFQSRSDDAGNFSIANVPSGTYTLDAEPAYGTTAYVGGYITADGGVTNDQAQAATIVVSADTTQNVTIPVAEHITGKVVMPNGIPVNMPAVEAFSGGVMVGGGTSLPDGTFDLAVPAGSYQVVLDYGGGTGDGYYSATAPGGFTFNKARATLVASTSNGGQGLAIVQPALPQITGRLFDGNGKPLANAYVFLYTAGSSAAPSMTMTNVSGWFAASTAPGKYLVLVGGNGNIMDAGRGGPVGPLEAAYSQQGWYTRHTKDHFTPNQSKASEVTVGVSGVHGLNVTIPNAVSISGKVLRPNGKGLGGVRADALNPTTGAVVASGITAPNGTYSIAGLNSGSYKVRFVDPSGVFNVGYAGKNGTVNNIARAAVIKIGTTNLAGINASLTRAKN